jgi:hypothetical protein
VPFAIYVLLLFGGAVATGVPWWARALASAGILVLAVVAWRVLRLAVVATPDCLVIRNFRNEHRVPWEEVEEIFGPRRPPGAAYMENPLAAPMVGLFVRLREGAAISCTLYARMFRSDWRKINDAAARLGELRERYTRGSGAISDVAVSAPDLLS